MNRWLLGLVALLLLIVAFATLVIGAGGSTTAGFGTGALRVGLVLGALWLALPQIHGFLSRAPRWLIVATVIAVVVALVSPTRAVLWIVIPLIPVLWLLGPRLATKADKPILRRRFRRRA
jgi:ABC-type transport system involved in cytochrome bd biosynthesis fused ATPase/permease subunit